MPLIMDKDEKETILAALRYYHSAQSRYVLEQLERNPDCTEWWVLTAEEAKEIGGKKGK